MRQRCKISFEFINGHTLLNRLFKYLKNDKSLIFLKQPHQNKAVFFICVTGLYVPIIKPGSHSMNLCVFFNE